MRIDIQGLGFPLTAALADHIERRLRFAMTRGGGPIRRVTVRLGDRNGPRGGEDKFCKIQVVLEHAPSVLIEDVGADLYAVVDSAAERAGRNVTRRLDRVHESARLTKSELRRSLPGEATDLFNAPKRV
jgi:ribosome-associated translation inhibitor RaiA